MNRRLPVVIAGHLLPLRFRRHRASVIRHRHPSLPIFLIVRCLRVCDGCDGFFFNRAGRIFPDSPISVNLPKSFRRYSFFSYICKPIAIDSYLLNDVNDEEKGL